jgi:hypothetical protein
MATLRERERRETFTGQQVYVEMRARGTTYAELTVLRTMQRMKDEPIRPPYARLEHVGGEGFRVRPTTA